MGKQLDVDGSSVMQDPFIANSIQTEYRKTLCLDILLTKDSSSLMVGFSSLDSDLV